MSSSKSAVAENCGEEGQYRELIEGVSSIVLRMDKAGNILFANRYACDFFGYARDELLGKNVVGAIVPPCDSSGRNLSEHIRGVCEHPELHENDENENTRKNGERVWVSWTNKAIRDSAGMPKEILCIGNDITARKRAEEKLQQEQHMLRRLLEAQHHELQMVAYEIHDGLAQLLTAAVMRLEIFERLHAEKPKEARKSYDMARNNLDQAVVETRRLIRGLRPSVIEESGIASAIELMVAERQEQSGIKMEFVCDVHFKHLDSLLESALYRIAQEGLTNAIRYSKSKLVRVTLLQHEDTISLEIRDWGEGFDTKAVGASHFGLEGIRERARILGGQSKIESSPDQGTLIFVELPMSCPMEAE